MQFKLASTLFAFAAVALAAVTPGITLDERAVVRRSLSGQATFYGGNTQGGACSFSTYTIPSGLHGTALSSSNWDNSGNCGGCVNVRYQGKSITAMVSNENSAGRSELADWENQIVDECPGCGSNHLDLFPKAFSDLAASSVGVIDVEWDYVPCPDIKGGLQIHMKSGVSEYWFSAQVVNGHRRTAKMEVSTDGGSSWTTATRTTYNFFEISSGVGASSARIRVTSHTGSVVVVEDVKMNPDVIVTASSSTVPKGGAINYK